jgi:hypothetical protein
MRSSGALSYYVGPHSNHRGLFVDLDLTQLLGYDIQRTQFPSPATYLSLKVWQPDASSGNG